MNKNKNSLFHLEHWQKVTLWLIVYDFLAIVCSYLIALWLRFDCAYTKIPDTFLFICLKSVLIYACICILVFWQFRLYKSLWRFASYNELTRLVYATILTCLIHVCLVRSLFGYIPAPYFIFGIVIQFILTVGIRFSYRFIILIKSRRNDNIPEKKVLIVGAGNTGQMILRDIRYTPEVHEKVCCFIDDNTNKLGRYIDGIPIEGTRENILEIVDKYSIEKIYLAIPNINPEDKREILNICNATNCELLNFPKISNYDEEEISIKRMKEVSIEDLLGRDPIKVNDDDILQYVQDKVILVTGGGGSIGSELCRQIAKNHPKQLIIFDVYENNAYDIQLELKKNYPALDLVTLIGSVRDSRKIFKVFELYKPDIVYHAAAHKHVPLMEDSPCEAIKNNVIGTYKTAYAAISHGCKRFVLISTDKAVNPTNVMGASKRMCEMIIQSFNQKVKEGKANEIPQLFTHIQQDNMSEEIEKALETAHTEFVAVRFGNVLGSNGSVIPLFKKQIENGGPVTVTHPDIIRYFMTIPEAVGLVLTAGIKASGGEIFVLDMGEPVKIDTLARNLIRLSGYKPGVDIPIVYCGLRPGEKLYEEKLMAEEGLEKTDNDLIHIGKPIPFDTDVFLKQLGNIMDISYKNKDDMIRKEIKEIVSTYKEV